MGEVVNLRAARKAKARAAGEQAAAGNRAKFGRTRAEQQRDTAESERLARAVEGAKLGE